MLHYAHRRTVVGRLCTAAEGHVVVVYESRTLDAAAEVGIASLVKVGYADFVTCLSELLCTEHFQSLVYLLEAHGTVV